MSGEKQEEENWDPEEDDFLLEDVLARKRQRQD